MARLTEPTHNADVGGIPVQLIGMAEETTRGRRINHDHEATNMDAF